jgi:uncharacterized protein (TIGR02271 family)
MTTHTRSVAVGVFEDVTKAQQCVQELRRAGFREDQIGVVRREGDGRTATTLTEEKGNYAGTGAATGAVAGAGVGALWALGVAAGMLPAIGPVIAGGLFAAVLASAAGTAAVGGVLGALIGLGIPEDEAQYYESEFKAGRTIVTVRTDGHYDEAMNILRRHGAYDMSSSSASSTTSTAARTEAGKTVRLHEEQLQAHTQPVQTGEVTVRKEVHTEHQQINVPVTKEEVVIERLPVHGQATSSDIRPGEEVRIPVTEEKVHVNKETVAKEEVNVGKRKILQTETVGGTVRKEELKVEEKGNVDVRGDVKAPKQPKK